MAIAGVCDGQKTSPRTARLLAAGLPRIAQKLAEEATEVVIDAVRAHNIGRPNAAKHLDEALSYILGHDGVWATTADDIAEYYLANYYDQVKAWIAERKAQTET